MGLWGGIKNVVGAIGGGFKTPDVYDPNEQNFGLPQAEGQYQDFGNVANGAQGRMAGDQFRNAQSGLLRQLQADARGNGPGQQLVRQQAQGMADRGFAQQLAAAQGARPGQSAMAGRNAAFNGAQIQSQVGGQAAQAGLQARLGAMGQMGQVAQGARDTDLRQLGLNDQTQLEALRQRLGLTNMQQLGNEELEALRVKRGLGIASQPTTGERVIGGLAQAGGTAAMFL